MSRAPHRLLAPLWREAEAAALAMETLNAVDAQLKALDPDLSRDPLVDQGMLDMLLLCGVPEAVLNDALSRIDGSDDLPFERFETNAETRPLTEVNPNQIRVLPPTSSVRRVEREVGIEHQTRTFPPSNPNRLARQNSPAKIVGRLNRSRETIDRPNLIDRPSMEEVRLGARTVVGRTVPAPVEDRVQRLLVEQNSSETVTHVQNSSAQSSRTQTADWSLQLERVLERVEIRLRAEHSAQAVLRPVRSQQESGQAPPARSLKPSDHASARKHCAKTQMPPTVSTHGLARLAARFANDHRVPPKLPEPLIDQQVLQADSVQTRNFPASRTPAPSEDIPRALTGRSDEDLADRLAEMLRRDARRQGMLRSGGVR